MKILETAKFSRLRKKIREVHEREALFDAVQAIVDDPAAGKPLKAPASHEPVVPQSTRWHIAVVGLSAIGKPLTDRWVFRPQQVSRISGLAVGAAITEKTIAAVLINHNGILKNSTPQALRFAFLNHTDSLERLTIAKRIAGMLAGHKKKGIERVLIGQTLYEPYVKKYYPWQ